MIGSEQGGCTVIDDDRLHLILSLLNLCRYLLKIIMRGGWGTYLRIIGTVKALINGTGRNLHSEVEQTLSFHGL